MTSVTIDGRPATVRPGGTLLEACRAAGVHVPTLCHLDGLPPAGTCRLCLVEARGLPRPVPACATVALDGMSIATRTPALLRHRRAVVEALLASGGHVCAFCGASGRCELQALARELGVDASQRRPAPAAPPLDASHPRFALDPGRCVLCTRCVRACEREGPGTLHVVGRGAHTRLAAEGGAWGRSAACTGCGQCVAACPTGALVEKASAPQGLALAARPVSEAWRAPPPLARGVRRRRLATLWLGGCSGCHMSLLDLDERLLDLAPHLELVFSPLADARRFPRGVDLCLVEGAVASDDHLALLQTARRRSRVLVALGDCAASGGITAMRDRAGGAAAVLRRAFAPCAPSGGGELPALEPRVRALGEVTAVDLVLPGCPPRPELIHAALCDLVAGPDPRAARATRAG